MPYRIELKPSAVRDLAKFPRHAQERIKSRIDRLANNPRPPGVKKLEGGESLYRVRVGDYRIIYQIQNKILLILVVRVSHRRNVYR